MSRTAHASLHRSKMNFLRELFAAPAQPVVLLPHDGVCNTIPGWTPTWATPDVHKDPDCRSFPFYAHRGLGDGASYGQSDFAVQPSIAYAMAKQAV